ncbi:hypothetical protein BDV38DRAFT_250651 [Aspergillus pseudotamarii]|uniref:Uncharacterized protein n=1 Tax=Aspergillus pseudotamarii TaxID=132259 RepID=A0A5N6SQW3_ASPPS|nr:uncharacterized protein BDV38DRAFT_250651 [Aspergillus pseudotamarii]KAE8136131.1 hypothetical protein BDV38DRAFT_250651 [Aspergillus pseudotamarii]
MHLKQAPCWSYAVFPIKNPPAHTGYTTPYSQIRRISSSNAYSTIPGKASILMNGQPGLSSTRNTVPYPILNLREELYSRARYDCRRLHQRNKLHAAHTSPPKEARLECLQQAISPYEDHDIRWTDSNPRHDSQIPAQCRSGLKLDLQHRRLVVLVFIVGVFMQACFLTSQSYKDEFPAGGVSSQGGARLIESRRRRASCLGLGDAQVERFLLKRDPSGEGVTGCERMVYREVLPYCSYGG